MAVIDIFYSYSNLLEPVIPADPSYINYYSTSSTEIWCGYGGFSESVTVKFEGFNLGTPGAVVTGGAEYYYGEPGASFRDISLTADDIPAMLTSGYLAILGGNDTIRALNGTHTLVGGAGADEIFALDGGNDYIHGMHGRDYIDAGAGDDIIRGGHGPDQLIGGEGADWIWGGVGANDVWLGNSFADGAADQVFVPVDSINNQYGNPGGLNRDMISGVEMQDRIFIHGVEDSALSFVEGVSDPRGTWNGQGVGIFANGTLEALITSGLSAAQVDSITTGGFFA